MNSRTRLKTTVRGGGQDIIVLFRRLPVVILPDLPKQMLL